jgi:hypothetical protein
MKTYPKIPMSSIVLRKPYRKLSNVPLTVYQVDPEPFKIVAYDGGRHVGKYQLKPLVLDALEARWYKPYELREVSPFDYRTLFSSPILEQYIREQYGDDTFENFYKTLPQKLGVILT